MASIKQGMMSEPKHTPGHDTSVVTVGQNSFMCPECGKLFTLQEAAELHLHSVHLDHLRKKHTEFHSKDVIGQHVE